MIWSSVAIFFLFLLVIGLMLMVTFYTINEFEKKILALIEVLNKRYNLSEHLSRQINEKVK